MSKLLNVFGYSDETKFRSKRLSFIQNNSDFTTLHNNLLIFYNEVYNHLKKYYSEITNKNKLLENYLLTIRSILRFPFLL